MGADIVDVRTADAAEPLARRPFDRVLVDPPCSDLGTLASRPDARWRKAGRPAALAALQARDPRPPERPPCGPAVPSSTRRARSRPPRTSTSWRRSWTPTTISRPTTWAAELPVWKHPTMPQYLQTLPHRDRTDGFFIARLTRVPDVDLGADLPVLPRAVAAADEPPRPLPLRELPAPLRAALGVPELRRALDDRADVEHRAVRLRPLPVVDARARFDASKASRRRSSPPTSARLVRAGRHRARRGRARDPRRRDGRPLRPADHDGPAGRRGDRRAGPRRGRGDRRAPDDRAPRAPGRGVREGGRGLDHRPRRGHAARALRVAGDPQRRLQRRRRAQPRHARRRPSASSRPTWCCA